MWKHRSYSSLWVGLFVLLSLISWGGNLFFSFFATDTDRGLQIALVMIASSFTITTIFLVKRSPYFIVTLFTGLYVSFLLFFNSQSWVWELGEAYRVKPVAAMIKQATTDKQIIFTSYPYHRPSLNFYSDRTIIPASNLDLQKYWRQEKNVYFLLESNISQQLNLPESQIIDTKEEWQLIAKNN